TLSSPLSVKVPGAARWNVTSKCELPVATMRLAALALALDWHDPCALIEEAPICDCWLAQARDSAAEHCCWPCSSWLKALKPAAASLCESAPAGQAAVSTWVEMVRCWLMGVMVPPAHTAPRAAAAHAANGRAEGHPLSLIWTSSPVSP